MGSDALCNDVSDQHAYEQWQWDYLQRLCTRGVAGRGQPIKESARLICGLGS